MAYSSPGLETLVAGFSPGWSGHAVQRLPEFLMQWLRPEVVLPAIDEAQAARFEFGETAGIIKLRLAAPQPAATPF